MNSNLHDILANKSRIETILDFLPYPFIISERQADTYINLYANKKFVEEIGYTLDEIPDIDSWFKKAYPESLYRGSIVQGWNDVIQDAARKSEDSAMMRVIITTKNNGDKWYEVKCSVSGPLQLVAFVNITEVMAKERELERLNENKNQTLSILAHDVRGPLTNLNTMTKWMLDGNFERQEFIDRLAKINEKSSQVLEFIDTTLLWTRANFNSVVLNIEEINITSALSKILAVYQNIYEAKQILVTQNINVNTLLADRDVFHIVVRNIFSNAIKFTNDNGSIVISTRKENGIFLLSIRDNGIGISQTLLEKIQFDHYTSTPGTREEKGLGLGLKLCRQLMKKINGKMSFQSEPGTGTEVTLTFPLL